MEKHYCSETENAMKTFYKNLNERDRRHFSALCSMQLPHGGKEYISSLLGIDKRTIYEGKVELQNDEVVTDNIRKAGGGRKPIRDTYPDLDKIFLKILKDHTAGDPMNNKIIWTDLTRLEIVGLLGDQGVEVSKVVVAHLLSLHGYVKRKIQKKRK